MQPNVHKTNDSSGGTYFGGKQSLGKRKQAYFLDMAVI